MPFSTATRRYQTLRECETLLARVKAWLKRRHDADTDPQNVYRGQYHSQRTALDAYFTQLATRLRTDLKAVREDLSTEQEYRICAHFERRLTWMGLVFDYFQSRFDQRDDESLAPILRAADEVTWACFRPPFELAGAKVVQGALLSPPPLPCIEPYFTPAAEQNTILTQGKLAPGKDLRPALEEFLRDLPVPVLYLPPWVVGSPWWLVVIAHEVGHHVQPSFQPEKSFADRLQQAAEKIPDWEYKEVDYAAAALWRGWQAEVFADIYSVALLGPYAIRAIAELEYGKSTGLREPTSPYPPVPIRLRLMAHAALRGGFPESSVMEALGGSLPPAAPADTTLSALEAQAKAIASAVWDVEPFATLKRLLFLGAFVPAVEGWQTELLKAAPNRTVEQSKGSVLRLVGATQAAWVKAAPVAPGIAVPNALDILAKNAVHYLQRAGEPGTRSSATTPNLTERAHRAADAALDLIEKASEETGADADDTVTLSE